MSESPSYHFSPLLASSTAKVLENKLKEEDGDGNDRKTREVNNKQESELGWKLELVYCVSDQAPFYKSSNVHLDPKQSVIQTYQNQISPARKWDC